MLWSELCTYYRSRTPHFKIIETSSWQFNFKIILGRFLNMISPKTKLSPIFAIVSYIMQSIIPYKWQISPFHHHYIMEKTLNNCPFLELTPSFLSPYPPWPANFNYCNNTKGPGICPFIDDHCSNWSPSMSIESRPARDQQIPHQSWLLSLKLSTYIEIYTFSRICLIIIEFI